MLEAQAPSPDKVACYVQQEPARKLKNLQNIPGAVPVDGWRATTASTTTAWRSGSIRPASRRSTSSRRTVGLSGNGHMMMLEKNSADIAKYIGTWLSANARAGRGENPSRAMPPKSITTHPDRFHRAQRCVFYAGGQYALDGRPPCDARRDVHRSVGAQTDPAALPGDSVPRQRPDGRAVACRRLTAVPVGPIACSTKATSSYVMDYPARGRSAYVPAAGSRWQDADRRESQYPNGARARTHLDQRPRARRLSAREEPYAVAGRRQDRRSDFRHLHEESGPVRGRDRRAHAGRGCRAARHDRQSGHPVHTFAGRRLRLRHHGTAAAIRCLLMVALEPGGPQFGGVDTAKVEAGPRNPNSWGLTNNRYEYDPPANSPADLKAVLEAKQERPDEVRCWMQEEPARKLAKWQNIRILMASANATYHRVYDPCIPKFLKQAGAQVEFYRLEDVGHPRQQPCDDAREEQRRHHQVDHGVDEEEHSGGSNEHTVGPKAQRPWLVWWRLALHAGRTPEPGAEAQSRAVLWRIDIMRKRTWFVVTAALALTAAFQLGRWLTPVPVEAQQQPTRVAAVPGRKRWPGYVRRL